MPSNKVCRIGNGYYLYSRESYWDPKEKRSKQRHSTYVGKCDKDGNLLEPVKKRFDAVHSAFPVGPLSIFYATAKELSLTEHIQEVMEIDPQMASHILCLVLNQLVSKRPVDKIPAWVLKSPLVQWETLDPKGLTSYALGTALSNICYISSDTGKQDHGLWLQHEMTKTWREGTREPAYCYYDVTKQAYYGTNCFYGEPGYIPGGTNKQVLGFGLVTSRDNHFPVLCRPIRGSKHDTVTVQDTVNTLKAWGFEHLTMTMDRGMVSKENVDFVLRSGFDIIGMVPETNKKAWEYVTRWSPKGLAKPQFVVTRPSGKTVYARVWTAPLFNGTNMKVAVVEDPERKMEEKLGRDQALKELRGTPSPQRIKELRREIGDLAVPAPGRRGFIVNEDLVEENSKGDGRFLMFSTDMSLEAEDMLTTYYQKDTIEKTFKTVKGEIKLAPIRYRREDRIDAYSTIIYLAYLIWRKAELKLREKYPSMTLTQALAIVEDVSWIRFGSGKSIRDWTTNLTKDQEEILDTVGAIKVLPVS
jgi:hypothetical protein